MSMSMGMDMIKFKMNKNKGSLILCFFFEKIEKIATNNLT